MATAIIGIEGSSKFLRIRDLALGGEPVTDLTSGVTVTYELLDRNRTVIASGPLTYVAGLWEAEIALPTEQELTIKWEAVRGTSTGRWKQRGVVEGY